MRLGDLYIAGTGLYVPPRLRLEDAVAAGQYTAQELAVTQLESVAVSPDVYPPDMAVSAANQALDGCGHERESIAIALHAHLGDQGLPGWHAASYVHRFAVGNTCPVIEIDQKSNGGMAALGLAASHLTAWDDRPAALITTADRFEDIPHGRFRFDDVMVLGDGAAACVVSREHGFARLRSFCVHTDTELEEVHRGAAVFTGDDRDHVSSFQQRKQEYFADHSPLATVARFAQGSHAAISGALADAGVEREDIDHWAVPNIGRSELDNSYLQPLGIALESTCWSFGRTVGHLGAGDQIAGLHHLRTTGRLRAGQLCALVGIGAGFSWSCAVVEALDTVE